MNVEQQTRNILQEMENDLSKITDPVEKYVAMSIVSVGKSIAVLTANMQWDMLADMEQSIGALFIQAHMVQKMWENQVQH